MGHEIPKAITMEYESLTSRPRPISLLLKGPSGSGKTTKAAQFPRPVIINLDGNLASLHKLEKEVKEGIKILNPRIKDGERLPGQQVWDRMIDMINGALEDPEVDTIVLDSLSTLSEILTDHVLKSDNPGQQMTLQQWGSYGRFTKFLMEELAAVNEQKHIVVTAHEEVIKDDLTGEIIYTLLYSGKMRGNLDLYFTDVWRTYIEAGKDGTKYMVRTVPSRQIKSAKTSLPLPETFCWDDKKGEIKALLDFGGNTSPQSPTQD